MLLEEEYYIGVPHLDAQHRALFKTMDRVKDILMKDDYERNKRLCKEAIKFFVDHASRHFSDEEEYMRSIMSCTKRSTTPSKKTSSFLSKTLLPATILPSPSNIC